ncbi:MAG: hypothetical protein HY401_01505 [Elusimicrobia bacterium]|nr:hypothetical protein [Elusimicrobiota bacterium]
MARHLLLFFLLFAQAKGLGALGTQDHFRSCEIFDAARKPQPRNVNAVIGSSATGREAFVDAAPARQETASPAFESLTGRKPGKEPRSFGRMMAKIAKGLAGLLVGLIFGAILGAAAGGFLSVKSINPAIRRRRYLLLLPFVVLGAVAGQIFFPYLFARYGMDAKSYPKIPKERK